MATIFFRLMTGEFRSENWSAENDFTDVSAADWFNNAVSTAATAGILGGYPDGSFQPSREITRAEAITLINRMLDRVPDGEFLLENMITFSDNLPGKWYYADVQEATNSHNYDRDEIGVTEIWTELLSAVDWTALEKEWATAATGVGANVGAGLNGGSEAEGEAQPEETAGDGEV